MSKLSNKLGSLTGMATDLKGKFKPVKLRLKIDQEFYLAEGFNNYIHSGITCMFSRLFCSRAKSRFLICSNSVNYWNRHVPFFFFTLSFLPWIWWSLWIWKSTTISNVFISNIDVIEAKSFTSPSMWLLITTCFRGILSIFALTLMAWIHFILRLQCLNNFSHLLWNPQRNHEKYSNVFFISIRKFLSFSSFVDFLLSTALFFMSISSYYLLNIVKISGHRNSTVKLSNTFLSIIVNLNFANISGDLGNMDNPFFAIIPKSILILNGNTYLPQIKLFKNYSYPIGPCAKNTFFR